MATFYFAKMLLDGTGRDPLPDPVIAVEGKNIIKVGNREELQVDTSSDRVIDLGERVILPGLIDSHCHIFYIVQPTGPPPSKGDPASMIQRILSGLEGARWWLSQGVTTIRDLGSDLNLDLGLRDLVAQGKVKGPRIFGSGRPIVAAGRPSRSGHPVSSAADARSAAREQLRAGADVIKMFASAGVGGAFGKMIGPVGWEQLTVEEMQAAAFEAHKAGRLITAHALSTQSIKDALMAGVDSIEHASFLDEEGLAMMKSQGVFMIPTLAISENLAARGTSYGFGAHMEENARAVVESGRLSTQMAHQAGVPIAAGTDPTRRDTLAKECVCLNKAGLSPMQVVIAATRTGAELLRIQDRLGTVEAGKIADFIALDANPLEDLAAMEDVSWVIKEGQVMKSPDDPL